MVNNKGTATKGFAFIVVSPTKPPAMQVEPDSFSFK